MTQNYETKEWEGGANCLKTTRHLIELAKPEWNWKLVHGKVIATRGIMKGKRTNHAWIEENNQLIIDKSSGKDTTITKKEYYNIAKATHTTKYTKKQALKLIETTGGHYFWNKQQRETIKNEQ